MADVSESRIDETRIERAAGVLFRLRAEAPDAPVERLARAAVEGVFCTRLAFSSEALECPLDAATEAKLAQEIIRRTGFGVARRTTYDDPDRVAVASDQAFPAGELPSWAWDGPTREEEHSSRPQTTSNGERR